MTTFSYNFIFKGLGVVYMQFLEICKQQQMIQCCTKDRYTGGIWNFPNGKANIMWLG